jgi:hypothetical protein
LLAGECGGLTQTSFRKTNNRYTAENSIIASTCLLSQIAATHFIPIPEEDLDIRQELKDQSAGVRELYDMVTDSLGVPVYPVRRELITSTDDTTEYIFDGCFKKGTGQFRLVSRESCTERGSRAVFNMDESNDMNGIRIKQTVTLNGAWLSSPIFLTLSGLCDRELKCPGDMLVIK